MKISIFIFFALCCVAHICFAQDLSGDNEEFSPRDFDLPAQPIGRRGGPRRMPMPQLSLEAQPLRVKRSPGEDNGPGQQMRDAMKKAAEETKKRAEEAMKSMEEMRKKMSG